MNGELRPRWFGAYLRSSKHKNRATGTSGNVG
jgi:hypothetical protein